MKILHCPGCGGFISEKNPYLKGYSTNIQVLCHKCWQIVNLDWGYILRKLIKGVKE